MCVFGHAQRKSWALTVGKPHQELKCPCREEKPGDSSSTNICKPADPPAMAETLWSALPATARETAQIESHGTCQPLDIGCAASLKIAWQPPTYEAHRGTIPEAPYQRHHRQRRRSRDDRGLFPLYTWPWRRICQWAHEWRQNEQVTAGAAL